MESLTKRRGILKGKLTRLNKYLDQLDRNNYCVEDVEIKLESLDENWRSFQDIHQEVILLCIDEDETLEHEEEGEEFETRYETLKTILVQLVRNKQVVMTRPVSTIQAHQVQNPGFSADVKLPRIDLPSFSGDYQDWTSFWDQFVACVHKNVKLSGSQKLNYLKSSLKGDASKLLKSLTITDANYDLAAKLLQERYDNKRNIVFSHLQSLFNLPACTSESAAQLRKLLDTTTENVRALQVLGQKTDEWDIMLIYMLSNKMDAETRRQWELSFESTDLPTYEELLKFMKKRCNALEVIGAQKQKPTNKVLANGKPSAVFHLSPQEKTCPLCKENHLLYHCQQFLQANPKERSEIVKQKKLCFNCLRSGHGSQSCTSGGCRKCEKKHNTLLHLESPKKSCNVTEIEKENVSLQSTMVDNLHLRQAAKQTQVLLSTVLLQVENCAGKMQNCRALLDDGSQATLISEGCINRLGLQRRKANTSINGISSTKAGVVRGIVRLDLHSNSSPFKIGADAYILPKITRKLPNYRIEQRNWPHIKDIPLADPYFFEPGEIDILIGKDIHPFIVIDGKITGAPGTPVAINTEFGWSLGGPVTSCINNKEIVSNHLSLDLDDQLQKFWQIEEISPSSPAFSQEEKECEAHFSKTHSRDENGVFTVDLPFKNDNFSLGESRSSAITQFKQIERRLAQNPHRKIQYTEFMKDYIDRGHMEIIPPDQVSISDSKCFYFPHHFVVNDSSTTTKLRVVFNGSKETSTKVSLNDKLMVGPKIQQDIVSIILRFRTHKVAFTADIAKMFRQIRVRESDLDFQRIIWRDSPELPIQDFRLLTVTYGTASAPYQAQKCLQQLAIDEKENYPLAHAVTLTDFYMDDIMSGASDTHTALELQSQLIAMMNSGGFQLRKWSSNNAELLESLPESYRETQIPLDVTLDKTVKTLGLQWSPAEDDFRFNVQLSENPNVLTKRGLLSEVAKIFDPLGWLAPTVITAKVLFQRLWLLGLKWDEKLPEDVSSVWKKYRDELPCIQTVKIPRWISAQGKCGNYQLIGFCDASQNAYAAVIYFRCKGEDGSIKIHLVCAKTKVAPIKQISLPRLELCGSLLLSRLMNNVKEALALNIQDIYAFTDSTIVLSWLRGHPNRWKTFVANRVSEIQDLLPPQIWNHVISEENPADVASRGIFPSELEFHPLWWNGPTWLQSEDWSIKKSEFHSDERALLEERKMISLVVEAKVDFTMMDEYSSISELLRITAYCLRFIGNMKRKKADRVCGNLKATELEKARRCWIKQVQSVEFPKDIYHCLSGKELSKKSRLKSLRPFVDEEGLLRVGGRLRHSSLSQNIKHPLILPRRHRLTNLIVEEEHLRNLHAGPQLLMSVLQRKYWIINARDVIRKYVHKCITCFRYKKTTSQQLMGDLPSHRLEPARPFLRTGVDYAGPITIRTAHGRGKKQTKGYIALFICFVTKAIHIELVSDLTTDAMLGALKRFISRRGICSDIYSDNGTSFVGAANELCELRKLAISTAHNEKIARTLANDGITWHRIPPSSPNYGGLWEAGIKSCKYHLRRIVGNSSFTFEEMSTILCQIEACLNSRPLCPASRDPEDLNVLTPGHFLIGDSLKAIPEPDLTKLKLNHLSRWQLIQRILQQFWKK